ncbi:hypothetical protein B9K06_09180 [Bacillus sp. OG2]|nr:hypothetical protein B9K06_09180 [Bacillus sp. OG2]
MESRIAPPQNRLSKNAVKVWITADMIGDIIAFTVLGILLYLDHYFAWKEWIGWILIGLVVITVLSIPWSIIRPMLLYKNWRYGVDEEFLKLKFGAITEKHQLVPMTKIQSVSASQGPLMRRYGLYSISIETMGSSHTIPALPDEVAMQLRDTIARLAKIKEVEQ